MIDAGYNPDQLTKMNDDAYSVAVAKLQAMSFTGFSGPVSFPPDSTKDGSGDRQSDFEVFQHIGDVRTRIGLLSATTWQIAYTSEFSFPGGYTMQNPPPPLFPACPERQTYDFELEMCQNIVCAKDEVLLLVAGQSFACTPCGPGLVPNSDKSDCTTCPAGTAPNRTAGLCDTCPSGHFCTVGEEEVQPCAEGSFGDEAGLTKCSRCDSGRFQDRTAATACKECPKSNGFDMTTRFMSSTQLSDCVCPQKSYLSAGGSCARCPEGMECPVGSSEAALVARIARDSGSAAPDHLAQQPVPAVLPGYYTKAPEPLIVYKCVIHDACLGGIPPNICARHRHGLNCARCEDGMYSKS